MVKNRSFRVVLATIATVLWLGYMWPGLLIIDTLVPTVRGSGPEGLAAFIGLIGGLVAAGFVMWAASD